MEGVVTSTDKGFAFRMENPFALKVGQIFTGFGIGCGIGIGVGRPIYLGAIPAFQQVLTATRGATDAFSGVGRHVNTSLKKFGLKNIEAGIGCGIGVGHGFGIGLALKPGVARGIQHILGQVMEKIMMNLGSVSGLSSTQALIPVSLQSNTSMLNGTESGNPKLSTDSSSTLEPKDAGSVIKYSRNDESSHQEATSSSYKSKQLLSEKSSGSRTEKVINDFLQDPLFQNDKMELNEVAGKLRSENNVLQMLLRHQQVIEELLEENQKLQKILVEDLKIPSSKLQAKNQSRNCAYDPCLDCFECRRRKRKGQR